MSKSQILLAKGDERWRATFDEQLLTIVEWTVGVKTLRNWTEGYWRDECLRSDTKAQAKMLANARIAEGWTSFVSVAPAEIPRPRLIIDTSRDGVSLTIL